MGAAFVAVAALVVRRLGVLRLGLAVISGQLAGVLLLDLVLPDVPEPADLVRQIRACTPDTAILLMSNLPPSALEKESARLGSDGWIPKAHKPEQLRNAVRAIVASKA